MLAGTIGKDARVNLEHGIAAYESIIDAPHNLNEAIRDAEALLEGSAERAMRLILVGCALGRRETRPSEPSP